MQKILFSVIGVLTLTLSNTGMSQSLKDIPVGEEVRFENIPKILKPQVCKSLDSIRKSIGPWVLEDSSSSVRNGEILAKIYKNGGGGWRGTNMQGDNCVANFYVNGTHNGTSYNVKFSCTVSDISRNDSSKPSFGIDSVSILSCK